MDQRCRRNDQSASAMPCMSDETFSAERQKGRGAVPALQYPVRGDNVIVWEEQRPDFRRQALEDLLRHLSFSAACAVVFGNGVSPKVVANRKVLEAIFGHLSERTIETGGLLMGGAYNFWEGDSGFVVTVEDFVRSDEY